MAANLKEVRERIRSVNSTQQITKAMKMVSAAKLRRAQQAIQQMRPYAEKQSSLLRNILSNLEGDFSSTFSTQRPVSKACVVRIHRSDFFFNLLTQLSASNPSYHTGSNHKNMNSNIITNPPSKNANVCQYHG